MVMRMFSGFASRGFFLSRRQVPGDGRNATLRDEDD